MKHDFNIRRSKSFLNKFPRTFGTGIINDIDLICKRNGFRNNIADLLLYFIAWYDNCDHSSYLKPSKIGNIRKIPNNMPFRQSRKDLDAEQKLWKFVLLQNSDEPEI